jgi:DNA-directed RNA polymerase subunit RPC12/RpoP
MALIKCPECKRKISDVAISCPNCGYKLTPERVAEIKKNSQPVQKGWGIVSLAVAVIAISAILYMIYFFPQDFKNIKATIKNKIQQLQGSKVQEQKQIKTPVSEKKPTQKADEIRVIPKLFFGIYLGEKISDLTKRVNIVEKKQMYGVSDDPSKEWQVQSSNSNVNEITVLTFEDRVWRIGIDLSDKSESNFNALKNELQQTYGGGKQEDFIGRRKATFSPTVDGVQLLITLHWTKNYNLRRNDGSLRLSYIHGVLALKANAELNRQKVEKLKDNM